MTTRGGALALLLASAAAPQPLPAPPAAPPSPLAYRIEARLDAARHELSGRLSLSWINHTGLGVDRFPFHLYWNAFRDGDSSYAREAGLADPGPERRGFVELDALALTQPFEQDLLPGLRYRQPDDGNSRDRTLAEVRSARPIEPGESARFEIAWRGRLPASGLGRAGWTGDEVFVSQWYPKLAGWRGGDWSAHQYHAWSEFFGDFARFSVTLTLPADLHVGATGRRSSDSGARADATRTLSFAADAVHDFAWAASPRFVVRERRLPQPGAAPVAVRLLLQPEHRHHAERYFEALRIGLDEYGRWAAPYPWPQLTLVDPSWRSLAGGMEYPTLIAAGAPTWSPPPLLEIEDVTLHELAHQLWYGLVATDEVEQAWLDEGFASWASERVLAQVWGGAAWGRRWFALDQGEGIGWPLAEPRILLPRGSRQRAALRAWGGGEPVARRSYAYSSRESWAVNSYDAPALTLQTLEGLVGRATMDRIVASWTRRYAWAHPSAEDLIAVTSEVTGADWRWFFDEAWSSGELCDYQVRVTPDPVGGDRVELLRLGGLRLPLELEVELADGRRLRERWDGRGRSSRYRYDARVLRAVADPDARLALDVDPSNDAWTAESGAAPRAATRWTLRFALWLQSLLELHALLL